MLAIDFEEANLTLEKPASMTDEECSSIRAYKGVDEGNSPFILTIWQPSKEDIEAINAGRPICLKTLGHSFAPVALFTYDEDYKPNV